MIREGGKERDLDERGSEVEYCQMLAVAQVHCRHDNGCCTICGPRVDQVREGVKAADCEGQEILPIVHGLRWYYKVR